MFPDKQKVYVRRLSYRFHFTPQIVTVVTRYLPLELKILLPHIVRERVSSLFSGNDKKQNQDYIFLPSTRCLG